MNRVTRKHIPDQDTILHVASNLPFACDGRLILDPKLKQVLYMLHYCEEQVVTIDR